MQVGTQDTDRERGSSLILVMITLVVVSLLVEGVLTSTKAESDATTGTTDRVAAFYAARGGLEAALNDLSSTGTGSGNVQGATSGSSYTVGAAAEDVTNLLTDAAGADGYPDLVSDEQLARQANGSFQARSTDLGGNRFRIVAKGKVDSSIRILEGVVERVDDRLYPFKRGLFSDRALIILSNPTIDSYSSSAGSYTSQVDPKTGVANANGNVGSNGHILLASNTTINGEARPGPGGKLWTGSNVNVTGDTSNLPSPAENPPPTWTVPTAADPDLVMTHGYEQEIEIEDASTLTFGPGKHVIKSLELDDNGAKVKISGTASDVIEIYVTGGAQVTDDPSIELKKGTIELVHGGTKAAGLPTLKVYNAGKLVMDSNSRINVTKGPKGSVGTPELVRYFSSYKSDLSDSSDLGVEIKSNSEFSGTIYAPEASISFRSNAASYGAVVGALVVLGSNSKFHYDEDLASVASEGKVVAYHYKVVMIRELR
jgi:Tfp pilus assembly protein PilX